MLSDRVYFRALGSDGGYNHKRDELLRPNQSCEPPRAGRIDWQRLVNKTSALQSSTLGNLVSILSRHEISREDLTYLKWVKVKRDFFIHRFFHRGEWPGELEGGEIDAACRKLLYLEIIFRRASRRIWHIFARSNLITLHDLGSDGILMTNLGSFEGNPERLVIEDSVQIDKA